MEIIAVLLFIIVVIFSIVILNQLEEIYDLKVELEKKNWIINHQDELLEELINDK